MNRIHQRTVRLNDDELKVLEALEILHGTDGASIFRMSCLEHARQQGITIEVARKTVADHHKHNK